MNEFRNTAPPTSTRNFLGTKKKVKTKEDYETEALSADIAVMDEKKWHNYKETQLDVNKISEEHRWENPAAWKRYSDEEKQKSWNIQFQYSIDGDVYKDLIGLGKYNIERREGAKKNAPLGQTARIEEPPQQVIELANLPANSIQSMFPVPSPTSLEGDTHYIVVSNADKSLLQAHVNELMMGKSHLWPGWIFQPIGGVSGFMQQHGHNKTSYSTKFMQSMIGKRISALGKSALSAIRGQQISSVGGKKYKKSKTLRRRKIKHAATRHASTRHAYTRHAYKRIKA